MDRKRLTETAIKNAIVPDGRRELWLRDAQVPGYAIRCLPGGAKTHTYIYRPLGAGRSANPRYFKLGAWPALGLDDARAAARIAAGEVAKGHDPAEQRAERKRRTRAALGKLLAEGGPYELALKARGIVNVQPALSAWRRNLRPHMATDVAKLTRNDIVTAIGALNKLGKPGAAADLRKFARSFLEWAVAEGLARFNVLAGLRAPGKTRAQRLDEAAAKAGKVLSDGEIVRVWGAAQAMPNQSFGALVQMALLTGMRRGELAQLQREHVLDGEHAVDRVDGITGPRIHLPAAITKTAADHEISLTQMMRAIVDARVETLSPLVFPSRRGGRITGWIKLVASLRAASGVALRLHDLRRTCRTLMSRLGIPEDVAELAIGHQRADLVKDQAWPGRVEAFEKVSAHINALLVEAAAAEEPHNVIAMRGR